MHMNVIMRYRRVLWRWQTRGKNNNVPSSDCRRSHIYLHAVMLGRDQTCSERGRREGGGRREEVIKRRKEIKEGINRRYGVPPPNALALSTIRLSASLRDIHKLDAAVQLLTGRFLQNIWRTITELCLSRFSSERAVRCITQLQKMYWDIYFGLKKPVQRSELHWCDPPCRSLWGRRWPTDFPHRAVKKSLQRLVHWRRRWSIIWVYGRTYCSALWLCAVVWHL